MFLNFLKNYFLKIKLKNSLTNLKNNHFNEKVKTVGILIDESHFSNKEAFLNEIVSNKILRNNISLLVYNDKFKNSETISFPFFCFQNINWDGTFIKQELNFFLSQEFDLLISYYDVEKTPLMLFTNQSKANFKVGFSSID